MASGTGALRRRAYRARSRAAADQTGSGRVRLRVRTLALLLEEMNQRARSGRCEQALNRLDAVRFPIASELRGSPTYTPDGAARPGPPELTDGAQG